ncbi:DNA-binding response OmpR family regulator [Chitinivorax tropicus]|uniref:DNA-binding response OmpR family regulator n=1 Tax=Chitinivorax tropicus TaxID=714531 RepID=A0A840MKL4_9PROT|nr:response regulator [Chitinivorax tropicus]MBB5017252.1 DNA-binding response OmpR family regulator [Chitinivorax tropicus]
MKKILIVEDQDDIRKLIRMTLEFEDFEIHEAPEGATGLKMVESVRPDLVLLDVMMPGELDGFQVCQRIKYNPGWQHIKVIMLTARTQKMDRSVGEAMGADGYLTKPFSPLELIETIENRLVQV